MRRVVFVLLAFTIGSVVSLIVAEVVVRIALPYRDLADLTAWKERPNPMAKWATTDAFCAYKPRKSEDWAAVDKTVNSFGFLSTPEISTDKSEGTIRIAFLGGSSTAGTGKMLSDEETWPWRTTERLQERFPDKEFEFINAAASGYTTFESYGRLWSRVRHFAPDYVILYHGWNDLYYLNPDIYKLLPTWRTLRDGSWSFEGSHIRYRKREPMAVDGWIQNSQALTHLRLRLTKKVRGEVGNLDPDMELAKTWDPRGLAEFRTNLRLFDSTCKAIGSKLLAVKQATLVVPDLSEELQSRCGYYYHGFDHDAHCEAFDALYEVIDEEIPSERVVDTTSLSGREELFFDAIHPTPEGTTAIAGIIADAIAEDIDRKSTKPNDSP